MSSNQSIIIDKGEHYEDYVRHIFRYLLSGPNPTFDCLIERTKYDWGTITEFLSGYIINNAIQKYNNLVASKEQTKTDIKDAKIITLTTCLSKLERKKQYILVTVQGGGVNITQTFTNTKGREPNNTYVEGLNNLESWRVNKSKDNITRYGQYWYWYPKHNM